MSSETAIVHVIDDDEALRDSLAFLLRTADLEVVSHPSAAAFLDALPVTGLTCIITDVRMPGLTGIDLLRRVKELGIEVPVIVITGHGDVPLAVEAMRFGAVDFLENLSTTRFCCRARGRHCANRLAQPTAERTRGDRKPAGDAVAARTRCAWRPGRRPRQQADRLRARHQPAHRGDLPRQSDGQNAGRKLVRPRAHGTHRRHIGPRMMARAAAVLSVDRVTGPPAA